MNPLIKKAEKKESKLSESTLENEKIDTENDTQILNIKNKITDFEKSEKSKKFGIFYKLNHIKPFIPEYQLKYFDQQFYFKNYEKKDGEWISQGETLCYVFTSTNSRFKPILSEKSGYLEHTKKYGQLLNENDRLSIIHNEGIYENENSAQKSEYKHYLNKTDFKSFEKWYVSDGELVRINDRIYQYNNSRFEKKTHTSEKEGYIDIVEPDKIYSLENNELLYIIREDDTKRINEKYINIPKIIFDDFTNSKKIEWENISTKFPKYLKPSNQGVYSKSDNNLIDLMFTFNYVDNKDYIIFHLNPKQLKPKENDKIQFLFKKNEKVEFIIKNNSISTKNNKNEKVFEIKSIITKSELESFAFQKFKKWKLSLISDGKEILGGEIGEEYNYKSKSNLITVINKFAREYVVLVNKEIENYKPTEIKQLEDIIVTNRDEFCYVYLMYDTSNQYYKIGISNKPKYRERTLQSEKPTIEMIISKKYPVRKIAESFEKSLHETYSNKRIRGEWFKLTEKDVEHIKESLK